LPVTTLKHGSSLTPNSMELTVAQLAVSIVRTIAVEDEPNLSLFNEVTTDANMTSREHDQSCRSGDQDGSCAE
jgi:hypothetical protein